MALAVVKVIDGASGGLGSWISDECRGLLGFVVSFGRALARVACGDRVGFVERVELALGLDVKRSGEAGLEEVLGEAECWSGEFLRGTVPAVDPFDPEGVLEEELQSSERNLLEERASGSSVAVV